VAEVQLVGVEAVGLDGAVGMRGEVALFQMAQGNGLTRRVGQRRPDIRRLAVMLDEGDDVEGRRAVRSAAASAA